MKQHYYYRLYFEVLNKQYSYVGTSKDLKTRIRKHLSCLKAVLNLEKDDNTQARIFYLYCIDAQKMPKSNVLYYKLALFMLKHNLTINDLKIESLKPVDLIAKNIHYLTIERYLIKKYHGFRFGFNGLNANKLAKSNNLEFIEDDYKICKDIIYKLYNLKYLSTFWWSYFSIGTTISQLGTKLRLDYKEDLNYFNTFLKNNSKFLETEKFFYRDKYQNSKIIKN